MTMHLVDIASYQAGMDLAKAKSAGFSLVNIKTSEGGTYTYTAAPAWADKARALGLGISTFHFLTNGASGRAQADRAYALMTQVGGGSADGMAHQCDNEADATWQITRDYVNAMQDHLGRHIAMYTGDWWWMDKARGWTGAGLTPYLWAAPNHGYDATYPGDTSPDWHAGYGGWGDYSLLQYAVGPIPGAGGGAISKTAIRDSQVWAALTGGDTMNWSDQLARQDGSTAAAGTLIANGFDRVVALNGWSDKVDGRLDALAARLDALAANPPGSVAITDEQLERVLRRVLGMAPATPAS